MQQLVQGHAAQIICPLGCPTLCKMGGGEEAAGQQKEEPGWGRWGPWITWRPARRERTPPHPHQQGLPKVRDSLCLSLPPCVSISKCLLGGGAGAAGSGRQGREGCRSPVPACPRTFPPVGFLRSQPGSLSGAARPAGPYLPLPCILWPPGPGAEREETGPHCSRPRGRGEGGPAWPGKALHFPLGDNPG